MPTEIDMQIAAWEDFYGLPRSKPLEPAEIPEHLKALRAISFSGSMTMRQYFETRYELGCKYALLAGYLTPADLKRAEMRLEDERLAATQGHRRAEEAQHYAETMAKTGDGSFKPLFKW